MRFTRILLVIIAVACFGVALSYPIRYRLAQNKNNANMDQLSEMRARVRDTDENETDAPGVPETGDAIGAEKEAGDPRADAGDGGTENAAAGGSEGASAGGSEGASTGGETPSGDERARDVDVNDPDYIPDEWADAEASADDEDVPVGVPKRSMPSSGDQAAASDGGSENDAGASQGTGEGEPARDESGGAPRENTGERPADATESEPPAGEGQAGGTAAGETSAPGSGGASGTEEADAPTPTPTPRPTPVAEPDLELLLLDGLSTPFPWWDDDALLYRATPTPEPSPTPVWDDYKGPLPYPMLEKIELDKSAMLPELREIYALNNDLVGWVNIPGTIIDYPVVQCEDSDYYLEHDFYGNANINGQIILDTLCDPYTPSYNLILSGHHMKNGSMFGDLPEYRNKAYWEKHKFLEFDSLMFRKQYVIFAAFYSADYDEDEEGFRYNANIQYKMEAKQWLKEIREYQLYDTGIDVQFGDEFITLTTCNRARHRNGRFVVVCRRIREGETIE